MIRHWLTKADAPLDCSFVKRFDPTHFTVDFPRGAAASVVLGENANSLVVTAEFLRPNDLIGLIYESEDRFAHPAHRREPKRDYSHCKLQFRWKSVGMPPLDAVNGPTLTIEGKNANGDARVWYVRLWNYASGRADDAEITLDFDRLAGGFSLVGGGDPVDPARIDRLFFSLVPQGYDGAIDTPFAEPRSARLEVSEIRTEGSGSVLDINDAVVPEHGLRICTAYDDAYHLVPERLVDSIERLGYRKVINHYVGVSHYPRLSGSGLVDPAVPVNDAADAWHRAFVAEAKRRGFEVILSLSFELLDMFCPTEWKQRRWNGAAALTGYDPPSTLISPASSAGTDYLRSVALHFCDVLARAGLPVRFQVGEPWWWVTPDHDLCLYDASAKVLLGGAPLRISDVRGEKTADERALLDQAGALLAAATAKIADAVRGAQPAAELLLLVYICGALSPDAPELRRANMPLGWAWPAFDVLQLEDYEWVTAKRWKLSGEALLLTSGRLGYPVNRQHYLAGFARADHAAADWQSILQAAARAVETGRSETFIWALPQVQRDGVTIFPTGDEAVNAFEDVLFPIEIGAEASISPSFSTTVVTSASGHEYRNANWAQSRMRFDAGPGIRGDGELRTLLTFFRARRGSAVGFRFRDPYDFSSSNDMVSPSATDQVLGTGNGEQAEFPLLKTYGTGEQRRITRPEPGSVRISIDGKQVSSGWSVEAEGVVAFDQPPANGALVRAGFLFDVPVRFATDQLEVNRASFQAGEAPTVPLIEIREGRG